MDNKELREKLDSLIKEKEKQKKAFLELEKSFSNHRKLRNDQNKLVSDYKKKRQKYSQMMDEIRPEVDRKDDLIAQADAGGSYSELKKQYDELNWRYQTDVFSAATEKKLVKELDYLESRLKSADEVRKARKEYSKVADKLRSLREEANDVHNMVKQHAAESEAHHQEMLKIYEKQDAIKKKIMELDTEIANIKAELGKEFAKERNEKREIEKQMKEEQKQVEENKKEEIKGKAGGILEKFKKGEKVSLEELQALDELGLY